VVVLQILSGHVYLPASKSTLLGRRGVEGGGGSGEGGRGFDHRPTFHESVGVFDQRSQLGVFGVGTHVLEPVVLDRCYP
jgi:hypothetical protein